MHVYAYVHTLVHIHMCKYVCIYTCVCMCVHGYTHMYAYEHTLIIIQNCYGHYGQSREPGLAPLLQMDTKKRIPETFSVLPRDHCVALGS